MAADAFAIWNDEVVNNSLVIENGEYLLAESDLITNQPGHSSLRLTIEYNDVLPISVAWNFDLTALVLAPSNEQNPRWAVIAHQFNPFRRDIQGKIRTIELGPHLPNMESVDDIVYYGNRSRERASLRPGRLSGTGFKLRIMLSEYSYGLPAAFQSMNLSAYGEMYSV